MKKLLLILLCVPIIGFGQGWNQLGIDIDGEAVEDRLGHAVAINGNGTVIAAGALSNGQNGANSGHVKIYEYISGVWTQKGQDIDGEAAADGSGSSVALNNDGNIVAIGAPYNSGNGAIDLSTYNPTVWWRMGDNNGGTGTTISNEGTGSSNNMILYNGANITNSTP